MKLSKEKTDRIKENVLALLFQNSPKTLFASDIARDTARDEEFIKSILQELQTKGLVIAVQKNARGKDYTRRIRWRLSDKVYKTYKELAKKGIEVY